MRSLFAIPAVVITFLARAVMAHKKASGSSSLGVANLVERGNETSLLGRLQSMAWFVVSVNGCAVPRGTR